AGVNARIEGGSIKVMEDSVVAREGEEVDNQVAEVLQKLDIYPIEVGLELRVVLEDGTLFDPETLDIDEDEYRADLEAAAAGAYNLGINATVVNSTTVRPLIGKADSEARSLGVEAEVFEPEVIQQLVSNAYAGMKGLASQLDDEVLPEELRGVEGKEEAEDEEEEEEETQEQEAEETEKDEEETEGEAGDEQEEGEEGDEDEDISEGMGDLFG
ncbi:MAG: 50S ribosomal protein L10, partial [Halobacteria archaeon]|nr:50S ribosomal protein L10 [Halobacteria archaeon]